MKFDFLIPQPDLFSLTIEGDRIKLLAIDNSFASEIFREFTAEVTTYMIPSPTETIEGTRSFIAASRRGMEAGYNLQFVVVSKTTLEFLGNCGLHGENKVRTPEVGIWLKKDAHGYGYGREAVHALVDWAKKNIDLNYFSYPVESPKYSQPYNSRIFRGKSYTVISDDNPY